VTSQTTRKRPSASSRSGIKAKSPGACSAGSRNSVSWRKVRTLASRRKASSCPERTRASIKAGVQSRGAGGLEKTAQELRRDYCEQDRDHEQQPFRLNVARVRRFRLRPRVLFVRLHAPLYTQAAEGAGSSRSPRPVAPTPQRCHELRSTQARGERSASRSHRP
jgi:hypothetical protein